MALEPNATNPDGAPGIDPSLDPNQVRGQGNPAPAATPAKDPNFKPKEKEPDPTKPPEDKTEDKKEPASEDKKAEPSDDKPLDTAVWGDTSSENGNAVLALLQNSGVTPDEAKALLFDAVQAGDLSKVDRKALEAKVGKDKATIILTGADNFIKEQKAAAQAIVTDLHKEVGGEKNWKTIADWANKAMPDEELEQYRGMINAGGLQSKMAAKELMRLYEAADGNSSLDTKVALPGGKPSTPTEPPLSKAEYVKKLDALNRTHFGNPPAHLRQALLDARKRGQALGK